MAKRDDFSEPTPAKPLPGQTSMLGEDAKAEAKPDPKADPKAPPAPEPKSAWWLELFKLAFGARGDPHSAIDAADSAVKLLADLGVGPDGEHGSLKGVPEWAPKTAYEFGDRVQFEGHVFVCNGAGVSGTAGPLNEPVVKWKYAADQPGTGAPGSKVPPWNRGSLGAQGEAASKS